MAYLYRLIAVLLCCFASGAFAQVETMPASGQPIAPRPVWTGNSRAYATPLEACNQIGIIGYGWNWGLTVKDVDGNPAQKGCYWSAPPAPVAMTWQNTNQASSCVPMGALLTAACESAPTCPPGWFGPSSGSCSREKCADGTYKAPGTCPNPCAPRAGTSAGHWDIETTWALTGTQKQVCDTDAGHGGASGCLVTGVPSMCIKFGNDGAAHCSVNMRYTGASCTADPNGSVEVPGTGSTPPPAPTEGSGKSSCPPGTFEGVVNGSKVCAKPDGNDAIKGQGTETKTTTNPDGSTTTTETTTTTSCEAGGSCTTTKTTETTTVPAGGGGSSTQTQTESGTCERGSPGCGEDENPSSFGGSCLASFACDGDAIMCAVALEQHKRNCALFVDPSPESLLYEAEKGKTGPQYVADAVAVGPGNFSQVNSLGVGGQCIADRTVTVWNQQVVLPFSQVCPALQYLGSVLLFLSFLLAFRIVARG